MTPGWGAVFVGSLRTLASISQSVGRFGFDRDEESFLWTRQQPVDHALIRQCGHPRQAVFATIEAFHFELVTGFDPILLPKSRWQNDLTLR